jgi:hypothetical protein
MRRCLLLIPVVLVVLAVPLPAADSPETKSALEQDSSGWTNLLTDKDLKSWKRVPIPPTGKLRLQSPWSVSADGQTLICNGVGLHEMLLFDRELGDGIFHVEWKFTPVEGKKGYNSGVYVRNSADGKVWHQAQVGAGGVGFLFGQTLVDEKMKGFNIKAVGPQRGKGPGEWNTYELDCRGKTIKLWVNGAVTCTWDDCQVPKGYLGLEAEGWLIEFRNVKWKELK